MKIYISKSGFKYDVDHMPGATVNNEIVYSDHERWKRHADRLNSNVHDDNADIISDSKCKKYVAADRVVFAYWNKAKKLGTVNIRGLNIRKLP